MNVFGNDGGIWLIFIFSKLGHIHSLITNINIIEYNAYLVYQRCYTMITIRDYVMEFQFNIFLIKTIWNAYPYSNLLWQKMFSCVPYLNVTQLKFILLNLLLRNNRIAI